MAAMPWMPFLLLSTLWITWRVYLVFQKPLDDLEDVLGIDVPPVPEISLSSITKDAILLYWKPPDNYHSLLRQFIQINGVNIEEFEQSEGSVQLTGLKPGHAYGIRAIATNSAGNSTYSRLIQAQTIPSEGNVGIKRLADTEQHHAKRTGSVGRISQPLPSSDLQSNPAKQDSPMVNGVGNTESIDPLNARLDELRQSREESELELRRETEESESQKVTLSQNRDRIKQQLDGQEKEYQDKRKQVNELEKQLKISQRRKQAKEKSLQQKRMERQKMQDDMERWTEESLEMEEKIGSLKAQKITLEESCNQRMQQMQDKITAIFDEIRVLDDEIKDLGIKVSEKRKTARVMQDQEDKDSERREQVHDIRMAQLDSDYRSIYAENHQYDTDLQRLLEYRSSLAEDRLKNPARYAVLPGVEYSHQLGPARRNRLGSRANAVGLPAWPYSTGLGFNSTQASFQSSPRGIHSILTSGPVNYASQHDIDTLTGGALTSPTANSLLPKDLLGDADEDYTSNGYSQYSHIDSLGQRSQSWDQDPSSPQSMHSVSTSAINSPHESFSSIPNFHSMDSENSAIDSTRSPYLQHINATADASGSRRRSNIFGLGKQRPHKTSLHDLPAFGSLKPGQSQSFPLTPDSEPLARKKNGYSVWTSPMANLLNRGTTPLDGSEADTPNFARRTKRGIFGSKLDPSEVLGPLDRSSSPRPPSTNPYDIGPPRPSTDSNPFGWVANDGMRQRTSPLGGDWIAPQGTIGWSSSQSRRQSLQYGSTSNLSLGSIPIDPDEFGIPYKTNQPAPIGTERFDIKTRLRATPKLNPAAPSFTARLFTKKDKIPKVESESETAEATKTKTKSKIKNKEKRSKSRDKAQDYVRHVQSLEFDAAKLSEDGSTSHSHASPRLSRDTYSYIQDDESQSSMADNAASMTDSQSHSTSMSTTPAKETLMQRITRKSSSSKFSAAWKERSLFTSKKNGGEATTPGDVEEDPSSDYVSKGSAPDSAVATGSALSTPVIGVEKEKTGRLSSSWGRVMSMTGKAKGKNAAGKEEKERESMESEDMNDKQMA